VKNPIRNPSFLYSSTNSKYKYCTSAADKDYSLHDRKPIRRWSRLALPM